MAEHLPSPAVLPAFPVVSPLTTLPARDYQTRTPNAVHLLEDGKSTRTRRCRPAYLREEI
jgi:hypothetical protein